MAKNSKVFISVFPASNQQARNPVDNSMGIDRIDIGDFNGGYAGK